MKIPYRWIGEFVELKLGAAAAADRLVNAGLEVARVTPLAPAGLAGVVVGEIEAIASSARATATGSSSAASRRGASGSR
ncbi:MAG: hypothetical protein HYS77_15265 [Candidatus Rokubacteria bacterium]|nr:hypothetical protein [Candidatus Rokubacteria bacterium]